MTGKYHFVGVGGSGMMPLAMLLAGGATVTGSDRSFDRDAGDARIAPLRQAGVELRPQTAGAPSGATVVVSTAVEPDNPDLVGAAVIRHRSEILSDIIRSHPGRSIMIAGSSGKTTTTAMTAWILFRCGLDPLVYDGAGIPELAPQGARRGAGPAVLEVDESDGSIARFTPDIAVVTSVTEDHKPLEEIRALFHDFIGKARAVVLSEQAANVLAVGRGDVRIVPALAEAATPVLGDFNRINEGLAVVAAEQLGVARAAALEALRDFPGVDRRMQFVLRKEGRAVIDDFAHNPEKIAASLLAAKSLGRPLFVIFQPHGYGPTKFHAAAWGRAFASGLSSADRLRLLPIFDAGGSADRSISSALVLETAAGIDAAVRDRAAAQAEAAAFLSAGPATVLVLGARDPSLPQLARAIARIG